MLWSPMSEIFGWKHCFPVGMGLYSLTIGFNNLAPNMTTVIAFRVLAAAGSSCASSDHGEQFTAQIECSS